MWKSITLEDCSATLDGDVLTLSTSRMRRRFAWRDGAMLSLSVDRPGGASWAELEPARGLMLAGVEAPGEAGTIDARVIEADRVTPARLQVETITRHGTITVRRRFRLYPGCPAIACDIALRGDPAPGAGNAGTTGAQADALQRNIEDASLLGQASSQTDPDMVDRIATQGRHTRQTAVRFYDVTDRRNNLVEPRTVLPYRSELRLAGNLLLIESVLDGEGAFILKEAPCSDVQLAWPGFDFAVDQTSARVSGPGLSRADLAPDDWTPGYGVVIGVAEGGEAGLLDALRDYQERLRILEPGRDHMVMLNTWGDRGQDRRIGEAFALEEIAAGARLGVSHFQLDDGWQAGQSSNSASPGGRLSDIWSDRAFWTVHPERFPRGLAPVVEAAKAADIELCLWFNPSKDNSYANWRDDADALIGLHREHGIRTFKIDGVDIPDRAADLNFRRFLDAVVEATDGACVFNLDVTAGRRFGYHYFGEYGNLFLENRYTDWSNYHPHWTLRNLWQLSRYVPAQKLQIEFLNRWRNAGAYRTDDPLAPGNVPFAYCFALTMMAQPLAWFEASGLPEEAFELAEVMRTYREHQLAIHAGRIWPIGEEPSGASWTGFHSRGEAGGYVLVMREQTDRPGCRVRLRGVSQGTRFTHIAGPTQAHIGDPGDDGDVDITLPGPLTWGLWRYEA